MTSSCPPWGRFDAGRAVAVREWTWRGPDEMLAFYPSLDVYLCASRARARRTRVSRRLRAACPW